MDTRTLEEVLTTRLALQDPEFHLEVLPTGSVSGSIVSDSFDGMDHLERQHKIWDALDAVLGNNSSEMVGTLLAYSKTEWDWDSGVSQEPGDPKTKSS
jgi:acid stress-induced BolA-like protein IbaG/YrbA